MFALAKGLSEREYQQLRAAIETALMTASPTDCIGIGQCWQLYGEKNVKGETLPNPFGSSMYTEADTSP